MNSENITVKPVGVIRSPFKDVTRNVPIQGMLKPDTRGEVGIFPEYADGIRDLEGFSHIYILYGFHCSASEKLTVTPYLDPNTRGVFATRSPHRPNHIGMTLVRLVEVRGNDLVVSGIDMIDGTPVFDIKPFNPAYDSASPVTIGWMEPYFRNGNIPDTVTASIKQWKHE